MSQKYYENIKLKNGAGAVAAGSGPNACAAAVLEISTKLIRPGEKKTGTTA
jgi:hypothetical protein